MQNKLILSLTACLIYVSASFAQTNIFPSTGAAGVGTTSPDPSSLLEIVSTSKGILISRMNKSQRDAIAAPSTGLLIYQTNSTPGFYYYDGSKWTAVSPKGVNKSLSNLAAPTAVNVDLLSDSDNVRNIGSSLNSWKDIYLDGSVYLGGARFLAYQTGSGTGNTAVGSASLNVNTSGYSNTGVGFNSLFNNTTGAQNTASGYHTLFSNTTGTANVAIGYNALYSNTTGYSNVAIGKDALKSNQVRNGLVAIGDSALFNNGTQIMFGNDAIDNVAIGLKALYANTTGSENTAIGSFALSSNIFGQLNTATGSGALRNNVGDQNTAVGGLALWTNTTGGGNAAIGSYALYNNTTGSLNTAIGENALEENTTGNNNTALGYGALGFVSTGNNNTALGYGALGNESSGNNLVAVGDDALLRLSGGSGNCTAVGSEAGINNTTGGNNTYLGYHAGNTVSTGGSNTIIGYGADVSNGTFTNATAIGNLAVSGASNRVRIGNSSVTSIGGQVGWSTFSDGRVKNNIQQNVPGLAFINLLKPVTYHFNLNKQENISGRRDSSVYDCKYDIEKIQFTGFIAQDVETAAKKIGYDFSGIDVPKNDHDLYALRYSDFVVPLVKAVQELSVKNDSLQKQTDAQQKINADLQKQIDELRTIITSNTQNISASQNTIVSLTVASLDQNIPNPFNHTTTIHYTLPQNFLSAQIIITDNNGKTLKQINLPAGWRDTSGAVKGTVNIDASALSSGAYNYSLIVDGKMIATKQLMLVK